MRVLIYVCVDVCMCILRQLLLHIFVLMYVCWCVLVYIYVDARVNAFMYVLSYILMCVFVEYIYETNNACESIENTWV